MATSTTNTGWPDATNTGVPAGVALQELSAANLPAGVTMDSAGNLTVTQAGTVLSGLNIHGAVYIDAPNVTLSGCTITSTNFYIVNVASNATGAVVENCTINGTGMNNDGSYGIFGSGTFTGNNIYNVENGIGTSGPATIQNNYIHDLLASGSPHYDGIEIDGGSNVTISHNTIINSHDQTSAIMIDNYFGPISNISVDNNLLGGGGYTVYDDGHFTGGSITGVSFTNNHMASGAWGYTDFNATNPIYTGNVDDGATLIAALNTSANQSTSTSTSSSTSSTPPAAPAIASWSPDSGVVGDGITNANHLTLTGTAAANSTVTVYDGSTQLGTATVDSNGAWSYATSTLSDGAHHFTATDTVSGSTSAASTAVNVTVDTIAPAAPIETGDTVLSTHQVQVSGTAEANSTIAIYDGTTVVGTGATNSSGDWSVTTSALSAGSHALTATATDAAGNVSAHSSALDPVIASTSTSTSTSGLTSTSGSTSSSGTTTGHSGPVDFTWLWENSSQIATIKGTADANSHVNLYEGSTLVGTATTNSYGHWTFNTGTLSDTMHIFNAQEVNASGQVVASSSGQAMVGTTGSDVFTSTGGNDVFFGEGSIDTFNFKAGFGHAVITDGGVGDQFVFSTGQFANFAAVLSHAQQVGQDTVVTLGADTITMKNTPLNGLHSSDFHFV